MNAPCTYSPVRMAHTYKCRHSESGVVLIVALIMLVIISLLSITSMRNSASTEALAGNVRTTELATQAADMALRHCESSLIEILTTQAGGTSTGYTTTMSISNILAAKTPPNWQDISAWDTSGTTLTFTLPTSLLGGTTTYKRPAQCMIETQPIIKAGATTVSGTSSFVITARGFGPEVSDGSARPEGTEVWLQSHIELQ
jgi:Tfp pilus assembly protein PilX